MLVLHRHDILSLQRKILSLHWLKIPRCGLKSFWIRRMALDRRNYCQVVELAQKAGVSEIIGRIVNDLKDEAEPYWKMVMATIKKVVAMLGASDIDERLEVRLVDSIIHSFQ